MERVGFTAMWEVIMQVKHDDSDMPKEYKLKLKLMEEERINMEKEGRSMEKKVDKKASSVETLSIEPEAEDIESE
jgi:hypothetical protein